MGRRALRKIDPALDLTGIHYELESVSKPLDAPNLFGRIAPVEVEVGSGKGLFLQTAAECNPGRDFLGLEIARKYARYCAARIAKGSLTNAKIICGDAGHFFLDWLADQSVAAVHVYFPDPWWKKRHKKRRVMNDSFVAQIERVLYPGGKLHFWTDVEEYFASTLDMISAHPMLQGPLPDEPAPSADESNAPDYRTHYDRRCRLENQAVYRAAYVRR